MNADQAAVGVGFCLFSFTFVSSSLEFLGTILQDLQIRAFHGKNIGKILTKKSGNIQESYQELHEFLHWVDILPTQPTTNSHSYTKMNEVFVSQKLN